MRKIISFLLAAMGAGVLSVAIYYPLRVEVALVVKIVFFTFLLIDSILYFLASWGVWEKMKLFYPWIIALLVINIIALIFDDFGLVDAIVGLVNILIIALLLSDDKSRQE